MTQIAAHYDVDCHIPMVAMDHMPHVVTGMDIACVMGVAGMCCHPFFNNPYGIAMQHCVALLLHTT